MDSVIGVFWGFTILPFAVIFELYKQTNFTEGLNSRGTIKSFQAPLAFSEKQQLPQEELGAATARLAWSIATDTN